MWTRHTGVRGYVNPVVSVSQSTRMHTRNLGNQGECLDSVLTIFAALLSGLVACVWSCWDSRSTKFLFRSLLKLELFPVSSDLTSTGLRKRWPSLPCILEFEMLQTTATVSNRVFGSAGFWLSRLLSKIRADRKAKVQEELISEATFVKEGGFKAKGFDTELGSWPTHVLGTWCVLGKYCLACSGRKTDWMGSKDVSMMNELSCRNNMLLCFFSVCGNKISVAC